MDRLLKVRDVADALGVHRDTVLRWAHEGKLPSFRLPGGALRFREQEVVRMIETKARPPE